MPACYQRVKRISRVTVDPSTPLRKVALEYTWLWSCFNIELHVSVGIKMQLVSVWMTIKL